MDDCMEVRDSLQALPFELNPDQYSAWVEKFHNSAAANVTAMKFHEVSWTKS
jgi:hypothetical protein